MFGLYRRIFIVPLYLIVIVSGGCATTRNVQLGLPRPRSPVKLLVMQSPMTIEADRLQKVLAHDVKEKLSVSDELILQAVKHAQEYALTSMESALAKQPGLRVVKWPTQNKKFIDNIQHSESETAISQDEADHIQSVTGADALLRFDITDYGLTPKSWRKGYITFEVVTTLAIAAVIAYSGSTLAKGAAGVYLVQEAAEETAEAYAGFWALDVAYRPVKIKAELIRLNPVMTIWDTSNTGFSNLGLSRLTRKVSSSERDYQLDQATDDAVHDIVSDLSEFLIKLKPAQAITSPTEPNGS